MTANDHWQVKLPSGDILTVTLDELDSAFADGHIGASTLVRESGSPTWSTLGAVAGLDDGTAAPATRATARSAPRVDPFVVPTPAIPIAPSSMAPMALDFDDDVLAFAPKKRPTAIVVGICGACAILILAAVGLGGSTPAPAAAMAKTESHLSTAPVAVVAPVAAPAVDQAPTAASPSLTEAQKKAVQSADKKLKQKTTKKAPAPRKPAKDPFVKGGSKHDPLNKSL